MVLPLSFVQYVQELNWVRELGAQIGQQPSVAPATTHSRITERDRTRGRELWAEDLLQNQEVETVQGSLNLEEIIEGITPEVAQVLLRAIDTERTTVSEETWARVMDRLQSELGLPAAELQRLWWLFPVYRERPTELQGVFEEQLSVADSADTLEDTRSDASAKQIAAETSSNDEDRDRLAELLSESSSPTTAPARTIPKTTIFQRNCPKPMLSVFAISSLWPRQRTVYWRMSGSSIRTRNFIRT